MFLEAIGIGVLLPIIEFTKNPESIKDYQIFTFISDNSNFENEDELVLFLLFTIIFFFLFKGIFLIILNYVQNLFIQNLKARISKKLYSNYLNQHYSFHLKTNSAILLKHLQTDINYFIAFFTSIVIIITESALVSTILISVILINPMGSLITGLIFVTLSSLFYISLRGKILKWGSIREKLENQIYKTTLEGIKGFKELQLFGRTNYFIEKYNLDMDQLSKLNSKATTINLAPRFYLEFIAISVLIGFLAYNFTLANFPQDLMVTLGVFVAAVFKVIPSINKILASVQNFSYYKNSLEIIIKQLSHISNKKPLYLFYANLHFSKCIELKNIFFRYSKKRDLILKNINLEIKVGESIGIFGSSGSGKSTLVDVLVGLNKPNSGHVLLDKKINIHDNIESWFKKIGYIPQNIFLTDDTILKNIAFGISLKQIDYHKVNNAIKLAQLENLITELPEGINTMVGESGLKLSGGQRQRIGIARALYHDPDVLILDEATSSLDYKTEKDIMKSINRLKRKKTIIIVAHRINTLENCDSIYEVKNGQIRISNKLGKN